MGEQDDLIQLSKDIGKVSERVGKMEVQLEGNTCSLDNLADKLDTMEHHNQKVCALATTAMFFLTKVLPVVSTVVAIVLGLQELGII